jgi:hypothetical protein
MAESVRYQRMRLNFQSPWNLAHEVVKEWSVKFSLSGATNIAEADCPVTALDLATPVLYLVSPNTSLISWEHYPIGSATHDYAGGWQEGTHIGNGGAWEQAEVRQQLEVCVLAECEVGVSSKGRPTYLRKWIHDVYADPADPNAIPNPVDGPTVFDKWDHGSGPHNSVPVSPTTGQQGKGWQAETHLFTHQLRRGPKRKVAASSSAADDALNTIEDIVKALVINKVATGPTPIP